MINNTAHITALWDRVGTHDDERAFETLFDLYYAWLFRTSINIVKKKEIAEEVVEDVFFRLWQLRKDQSNIQNLSTYLYVATKHRSYNQFKKMAKIPNTEEVDVSQTAGYLANPEQDYLVSELQEHIDSAISQLPERCQEVFRLIRLDGLSYKQAAEVLNVAPKTIENQLSIAIKKMSMALNHYLSDAEDSKNSA